MKCQSFMQTLRLIRSDFRFRCEFEHKPMNALVVARLLFNPGIAAVLMIRLQRYFDTHYLRLIGWFLEMTNLILYSVKIDSRAEIGTELLIVHPHSIFISGDVDIGRRFVLFHQNAIGFSPFVESSDPPTTTRLVVGDNVIFGAGACAYGNIAIGDGCKVGVNAVVEASFPAGSVLFGVPARVVSKT